MKREISIEEMKKIATAKPFEDGGVPKWLLDEIVIPSVETYSSLLKHYGIRLAYIINTEEENN